VGVVSEVLKLLRSSIPSSIDIREELDRNGGFVVADPTLIHQVVMNLCTNAYQAMDNRKGTLTIRLRSVEIAAGQPPRCPDLRAARYVCLSVHDTGRGIPPEIADRIFEPFFSTKEVGQGTGLGLSVVHGIVAEYGGTVTFESRPEQGTTFYVYLPQAAGAAPGLNLAAEETPKGRERILFVDDEPPIARLAEQVLHNLGYIVTSRTSSLEAFELFRVQPKDFDLLISDFSMPKMTGGELVRRVREIRPDIPVILASGFNDEVVSAEQAAGLGVEEYLSKPFSVTLLAQSVRKVLDDKVNSRSAGA
jgi:CheY-like chemotaxis protein